MPTKVKNRRVDPRNRIPDFLDAQIELCAPDGSTHAHPLLDLSVGGGSFRMPQRIPGLGPGTMVDGGKIRVADIEIHAHVEILHVTRADPTSYLCGVRLYPASENDRNELIGLVARLGKLPS